MQSTTGKLGKRNNPDLVQAFPNVIIKIYDVLCNHKGFLCNPNITE